MNTFIVLSRLHDYPYFIHIMQQLVSYFSDLHFRSDRLLPGFRREECGTYSKKYFMIQVGITR